MASKQVRRWRCGECDEISTETELLTAPSPFDAEDTLTGCPHCKKVPVFTAICDEPGCTRAVCAGFPAGAEFGGYRQTCAEHYQGK